MRQLLLVIRNRHDDSAWGEETFVSCCSAILLPAHAIATPALLLRFSESAQRLPADLPPTANSTPAFQLDMRRSHFLGDG